MKLIAQRLLLILTFIFPGLKKAITEDLKNTEFKEIERNSKCYCKSGKKYKHCHLIRNEKKGRIAASYIDKKGFDRIKLFDKKQYLITVKNTFSETDIGIASGFTGVGR